LEDRELTFIDTNNNLTILYPSIHLPTTKPRQPARSVILIHHLVTASSYTQIGEYGNRGRMGRQRGREKRGVSSS
jgi:hypothetical protein